MSPNTRKCMAIEGEYPIKISYAIWGSIVCVKKIIKKIKINL